jgi:transcriptional regulator with XRE-family HTH domain
MDRREDEVLRKLGQRLTYLREKQNFTVSELAARSGLDPGMLEGIEAGRVDPTVVAIFALVEALGVSLGELVDGV